MARYSKVFNDIYPNGWKDKPDLSTPITAAAMNNFTDAIKNIETYLKNNPGGGGGTGTGGGSNDSAEIYYDPSNIDNQCLDVALLEKENVSVQDVLDAIRKFLGTFINDNSKAQVWAVGQIIVYDGNLFKCTNQTNLPPTKDEYDNYDTTNWTKLGTLISFLLDLSNNNVTLIDFLTYMGATIYNKESFVDSNGAINLDSMYSLIMSIESIWYTGSKFYLNYDNSLKEFNFNYGSSNCCFPSVGRDNWELVTGETPECGIFNPFEDYYYKGQYCWIPDWFNHNTKVYYKCKKDFCVYAWSNAYTSNIISDCLSNKIHYETSHLYSYIDETIGKEFDEDEYYGDNSYCIYEGDLYYCCKSSVPDISDSWCLLKDEEVFKRIKKNEDGYIFSDADDNVWLANYSYDGDVETISSYTIVSKYNYLSDYSSGSHVYYGFHEYETEDGETINLPLIYQAYAANSMDPESGDSSWEYFSGYTIPETISNSQEEMCLNLDNYALPYNSLTKDVINLQDIWRKITYSDDEHGDVSAYISKREKDIPYCHKGDIVYFNNKFYKCKYEYADVLAGVLRSLKNMPESNWGNMFEYCDILNKKAEEISYDNTESGLEATTVQEAIDEVYSSIGTGGSVNNDFGIKVEELPITLSSGWNYDGKIPKVLSIGDVQTVFNFAIQYETELSTTTIYTVGTYDSEKLKGQGRIITGNTNNGINGVMMLNNGTITYRPVSNNQYAIYSCSVTMTN